MRIIARSGRAGLALQERNWKRGGWNEAGHQLRRKVSDFGSGGNGEMGEIEEVFSPVENGSERRTRQREFDLTLLLLFVVN